LEHSTADHWVLGWVDCLVISSAGQLAVQMADQMADQMASLVLKMADRTVVQLAEPQEYQLVCPSAQQLVLSLVALLADQWDGWLVALSDFPWENRWDVMACQLGATKVHHSDLRWAAWKVVRLALWD
jgi:hypothetical protein